jgi:hypothetical protein
LLLGSLRSLWATFVCAIRVACAGACAVPVAVPVVLDAVPIAVPVVLDAVPVTVPVVLDAVPIAVLDAVLVACAGFGTTPATFISGAGQSGVLG